ncbi:fibronectin type III domain-containing protein 5 [Scomber scombrus]|uniref:fibronectin type III domain-containing protein 5 n=1 Tax=Scomber scombrus TaxID=13677 RepID=UPI002DDC2926|nr:fibronectin type III domain-containing protein 5 [Scomber scombrus]
MDPGPVGESDENAKRLTWQQQLADAACRLSSVTSECVQVDEGLSCHVERIKCFGCKDVHVIPIEVSVTGKESFTRQAMEELPKSPGVVATQKYNSLSPPVNVTIKAVKANSAVVTWDIPEGDPVIGFAITQQKKDVRMLRFIQEVNTTTRSCALWDLEEETDYIVHVASISMSGTSPLSEPLRFRTPKEAETQASKSKDEVTMEEVGQTTQLRAGELIIIVVVLIMWAGVIALFCRQYDIIKDNEPNNNKDKAKNSSECSTPEHPTGGLLRSKFPQNNNNNRMPSVNIIEV